MNIRQKRTWMVLLTVLFVVGLVSAFAFAAPTATKAGHKAAVSNTAVKGGGCPMMTGKPAGGGSCTMGKSVKSGKSGTCPMMSGSKAPKTVGAKCACCSDCKKDSKACANGKCLKVGTKNCTTQCKSSARSAKSAKPAASVAKAHAKK